MQSSLRFSLHFMLAASAALLMCGIAVALPPANRILEPGAGRTYIPHRPTINPYVGIARVRNSPVTNYFVLVKPQLEQQAINQQQQYRIQRVEQAQQQVQAQAAAAGITPIRATGYPASFRTHNPYFNNLAPPPQR